MTVATAETAVSQFDTIMAANPVYGTTEKGRGFLPPLLRGYGHAVFLSSWQASTKKPTDEQIADELKQGREHANLINISMVSTAAQESLKRIAEAWSAVEREFRAWTPAQREKNFVNLANLTLHSLVRLDRELLGLRESDIGNTL
jgi:hypothetical protein